LLFGSGVSLSCEVLPEIKEYERTITTVVNNGLKPVGLTVKTSADLVALIGETVKFLSKDEEDKRSGKP
jgi:N-methylhydantoinase A/oxoprolinase/acetone carboxylase beta subunit